MGVFCYLQSPIIYRVIISPISANESIIVVERLGDYVVFLKKDEKTLDFYQNESIIDGVD